MKLLFDKLRRHWPLTLLLLSVLFVPLSYLLGLVLGPILFDSFVTGILFLLLLVGAPLLIPLLLFKGVAVFFEHVEALQGARRQEEQQPGSVDPQEMGRLRLRFTIAVLIPLTLIATTFGYTVLLGRPILSM